MNTLFRQLLFIISVSTLGQLVLMWVDILRHSPTWWVPLTYTVLNMVFAVAVLIFRRRWRQLGGK